MENQRLNKKALAMGALCYVLWGTLPLYWRLLDGWDPLVILAGRILFSALFMTAVLACTGRLPALAATFRDRAKMRWLLPAALVITVNWGVYIWAVNSGRILDASLGYYMNPLVVFALGVLVFKERCGALSWIALGLAAAGVILSALLFGAFPYAALALAFSFAVYGLLKKYAHTDGLLSITVETLLIAPLALLFFIVSPASHAALATLRLSGALLLAGTGVVTALPLVLYTRGVNGLPFTAMGFLQFISPSLQLLIGLIVYKEPLNAAQLVAFACIWAGLAVYMFGLLRHERPGRLVYRRLRSRELSARLFAGFSRRQAVTRCLRLEDGRWVERDAAFIDDWTENDYRALTSCIQNTLKSGGFACAAFLGGRLKGFVTVEPEPFGRDGAYLDLSALHVSEELRGRHIGKTLFLAAAAWAQRRGARKLYISAHSAVETQAFYAAMGCVDAEERDAGHMAREPFDRQLEFLL
ncbi:MAG: EamA family transporter RarD [Clostridia bacterium]|nr:EamA family transporter RarD [Clostridia bacterium]